VNTAEASNSPHLMELKELKLEFDRYATEAWKELPLATEASITIDGKTWTTQAFLKKCAGSVPSDEEIVEFLQHVKDSCEPVYWLYRLGYLEVVDFPEGDDPTVKDFFLGNFDANTVSTKAALICYPLVEIK